MEQRLISYTKKVVMKLPESRILLSQVFVELPPIDTIDHLQFPNVHYHEVTIPSSQPSHSISSDTARILKPTTTDKIFTLRR
jgi:hypothetical protein